MATGSSIQDQSGAKPVAHMVREGRAAEPTGKWARVMARGGRPTVEIVLSEEERETLRRWARHPFAVDRLEAWATRPRRTGTKDPVSMDRSATTSGPDPRR